MNDRVERSTAEPSGTRFEATAPGRPELTERQVGRPPPPSPGGSGCLRYGIAGLLMGLGALMLVAAMVVVGVYRQGERFLDGAAALFTAPQPTPVVQTQALVVQELREASDLTTAVMTVETVVSESQDRQLGAFVIGETKLLYVAHGQVRAGVDLSALAETDVERLADETLVVHLPPPEVQDLKLDVDRSYVYDFDKSVFGPPGLDLQTRAERFALRQVLEAACEDGILGEANDRAVVTLETLLRTAGYQRVRVVPEPPAPGSCAAAAPPVATPPAP